MKRVSGTQALRDSKPATSTAVAKAAGVSQSTVSLVLSGKAAGRVTPETQARVEETARRMGYRRNVLADVFRSGLARTLALAVPNVRQPFFGEVLFAAELAARTHGYAIALLDLEADPSWAERVVDLLNSRLIAGCIIYAPDRQSQLTIAPMADRVVLIEADVPVAGSIDLDVEGGIEQAVRHLVGLGHERIGYFAADYPSTTFARRHKRFRSVAKACGLPFHQAWRVASAFEIDPATEAATTLLSRRAVTAVICDDDLLAGGVYRAARQLDIAIPDALSVVGFNDIEAARLLNPELTTIAIPADEIGRKAVELLLESLSQLERRSAETLMIDLSIRLRESTAPPVRSDAEHKIRKKARVRRGR